MVVLFAPDLPRQPLLGAKCSKFLHCIKQAAKTNELLLNLPSVILNSEALPFFSVQIEELFH